MPELRPPLPLSPTPPPPQNPQAHQATLPPLDSQPDQKFLTLPPEIAGRAVLIELYAPATRDRRLRESAWRSRQDEVNMVDLGLAAQALERTGLNWRQAQGIEEILEVSSSLSSDLLH